LKKGGERAQLPEVFSEQQAGCHCCKFSSFRLLGIFVFNQTIRALVAFIRIPGSKKNNNNISLIKEGGRAFFDCPFDRDIR